MSPLFLHRVMLKNYRSIGACDVRLSRLNFLVGPNGSGKSNFLDAIRFTTESLRISLEHALRERGGIAEVRRRSSRHPTHFGIRFEMHLPDNTPARYTFRIGARPGGGYVVQQEECTVGDARYRVEEGVVKDSFGQVAPPASPDRLYLVAAAGIEAFRPLYDALLGMSFFNPVPDVIRQPHPPDPAVHLTRDGRNLAGVLERLSRDAAVRERIQDYLGKIVPGLTGVDVKRALGLETIEFRQQMEGANAWRFRALSMSDGTLRALGLLVALFQHGSGQDDTGPLLVGLEEPEMALNPGAAGILFDALVEASHGRQVLVTTHSPDLLDRRDIETESLLAVVMERGQTFIGPIDEAGRTMLQQGLYSPGELLRLGNLLPDPALSRPRQRDLFGGGRR